MSLLDTFLLQFTSEGLSDLNEEVKDTDKALNHFEQTAKKAEKSNKKLDVSVTKSISNFKSLAMQATRTIAPFVLLGKAIGDSIQFASQAVEMAEEARKAGMSIEQYQAQGGNKYQIFTREDVNNAKDFEMTMRDVRMGLASIGANISKMFLPVLVKLSKIAKTVVDWFVEHSTLVKAGFIAIAVAITVAAIPAIISMGTALWGALAPILPILLAVTAAIAAVTLVVEDLYKWIHGEPSVAELLFGDFETFKNKVMVALNKVLDFFKPFIDTIKEMFDAVWDLLKAIFGFSEDEAVNFFEMLQVFIKANMILFQRLGEVIRKIFDSLPEWLKDFIKNGGALGVLAKLVTAGAKGAKKLVDGSHASGLDYVPFDGYIAELHKGERVQTAGEAQDWRSGLLAAQNAIRLTAQNPLNAIPQGTISNAYNNSSATNNRNINIGDITIQTQATSAQGIADDLASAIKRAVISLDDGMLA